MASSSSVNWRYPSDCSAGANGCKAPNSGQVTGIISLAALSFMVHEPRAIMVRSRARSLSARRRR
ncbi:hypothetical protein D3C76_885920 [compost metagenome]